MSHELTRNADPKTVQFARMRGRLTRPSGKLVALGLPAPKTHKVTLLSVTVSVLGVCTVSLIWISVAASLGMNIPRVAIVLTVIALFFLIVGVCAIIGRDYRDKVQLAAVQTVRAELRNGVVELQQSTLAAIAEVRAQVAYVRAECVAQFESLPGRFDEYADQKVLDSRADAALAQWERTTADGATADAVAPPQLSVVRQWPRAD
jgi:hypothetical protein